MLFIDIESNWSLNFLYDHCRFYNGFYIQGVFQESSRFTLERGWLGVSLKVWQLLEIIKHSIPTCDLFEWAKTLCQSFFNQRLWVLSWIGFLHLFRLEFDFECRKFQISEVIEIHSSRMFFLIIVDLSSLVLNLTTTWQAHIISSMISPCIGNSTSVDVK